MIEIEEADAPSEPARVEADAAGERAVLAEALAGVRVQRRRVAGEVGLEDVDRAVAVVVADRDAHAGLRLAVLAVGAARVDADVLERAVAVVPIQRARVRVVRHIEIDPPVVVEVERADAEAVGAVCARDAGRDRKRPRTCRRRCCGRARSCRRSVRAGHRRRGRPCSGTARIPAPAPSRDRSRCSWRRRDRGGRRGRSRGTRSRRPSACVLVSSPARSVTSSNVPSPRLRNRRFGPQNVTNRSSRPSLS